MQGYRSRSAEAEEEEKKKICEGCYAYRNRIVPV